MSRLRLFERLMRYAAREAKEIWFLGDIFDFWFEYRHTVPKGYSELLHSLATLRRAGITLNFIAGNHDYWTLDVFPDELGIHVYRKSVKTRLAGKQAFLSHGDEYSGRNRGYILFRELLRAGWFTSCYRLLHPDIAIPAGKFLSRRSRSKPKNRHEIASRYFRHSVKRNFAEGFEIVITAHTHCPALRVEKKSVYLNPGDWLLQRTFAELEGTKLRLMEWSPGDGPIISAATDVAAPRPADSSEFGRIL